MTLFGNRQRTFKAVNFYSLDITTPNAKGLPPRPSCQAASPLQSSAICSQLECGNYRGPMSYFSAMYFSKNAFRSLRLFFPSIRSNS